MIIDDEVLGNEPETPPVPEKGQAKTDENVTLSKAEHAALLRQLDESKNSERYWADMARRGGRAPEPAAEPEETDASEFYDEEDTASNLPDDTPAKLVDDFASQGISALQKRGFVTVAEAKRIAVEAAARVSRELIGRERQKITSDTQLMQEFPDLKDQKSELFQETAKIYQRAVAMDQSAAKTPAALYLAAEAAREKLKAKAPAPKAHREDDYEPEDDRRQRAASQDGRSRGRAPQEDTDMLGPEAKAVIKQMGITEEEYRASQKLMGGGRSRQGGRR